MEIINPHRFATSAQAFDGFGNASRSFNGTSHYISIPDINESTTTLSVACWIKTTQSGADKSFMSHWNVSSDKAWIMTLGNSGELRAVVSAVANGSTRKIYRTTNTINDGDWHHVVFTFTSNNLKLYIDGIEETTIKDSDNTVTSIYNSSDALTLGSGSDGSSIKFPTNCNLADVRIYDTDLSSTDISDLYNGTNITTNLVGHWIKDTPSLLDHAGNNDATNYGSKFSYDNPSPAVEFGSMSRLFNGASDYVDLGNSTDFSFSDTVQDEPFSLCAWIKCADNARFRVLSKDNGFGSSQEWLLATDAGGNLNVYLIDSGQFRGREYTTPLPENEWVHVASTYDGSGGSNFRLGLKLYVNGVQVDNANFGIAGYVAMSASTNNDVFIGRYGTSYSDGKIADARIYDAELSSTDVSDIYNGTNITTNLIGHWLTNNDDVEDKAGTNDGTNYGSTYSYDNPNALVEYGGASRDFSGVSQHIEASEIVSIGTGSMSWSCWLNADSIVNTRAIVRMGRSSLSGNARYDGLQILLVNSKISGYLIDYNNSGNVFPLQSANNAIVGDWYHVALTLDANAKTLELFVNGVSETSTSVSSIYPWDITAINPPSIGSREISDNNFTADEFNGKIADVRLYDSNLTSTEAYELYKGVDHRTNLIGQWLTNSDDVEDKAGINDGTNVGSTYSADSPL